MEYSLVLNLIINGIPSILQGILDNHEFDDCLVLNLIINGIPSILNILIFYSSYLYCFKPYYKWNTFNTERHEKLDEEIKKMEF